MPRGPGSGFRPAKCPRCLGEALDDQQGQRAAAVIVPQYREHSDLIAELIASGGGDPTAFRTPAAMQPELASTSAAVMLLLLQAHAEGLGACWMAGPTIAQDELERLCGIARPASLRRSLEALGATVVAERSFADHHRYHERDLRDLSGARLWITTEKDALKILPRWTHGVDVRVLLSGLEVEQGDAFVDGLERTLRAKRR